jgi:membrane-associated phospholipid phosphatase
MLLWAGIVLVAAGIASIAIDRPASHFLYERVSLRFWRFLDSTTHLAKASHWLIAAVLAYGLAALVIHERGPAPGWEMVRQCALAFVASLAVGSAILHTIKLFFGRRRPRDDIEMGLYGFMPFSFDLDYNSFPSGHALTIMCVAVIASAVCPQLAALWFAIAAWLGLTRALLTAHYLSDVLVGAGIGLLSAREVVINFFPQLALPWF